MDEATANREVRFDVFISHASEDNDDFVRPLAAELTRLGIRVWYDEWTLTLGDSLRRKIDEGLIESKFGVVIVSRYFVAKNWPQAELDGLFAREMQGQKVILPVWHNISRDEVLRYSPTLAGKLAAPTEEGIESVAGKIFAVVRPDTLLSPVAIAPYPVRMPNATRGNQGGKYQIALGKRHRHLREKLLKINLRQMASFYGFEKVAQLEAYERGEDEIPPASIRKLRDFFFISREYLEEGAPEVFDTFDVMCRSEDCEKFIDQGFDPYLLCLNEDRHQLWARPVFHREEDGFDRIICGNENGYFASAGGGKSNIMHLIKALQIHEKDRYEVQIHKVDRKIWKELENRTFYLKGMYPFCGPDDDAQERFFSWFEEFKQKPAKW